MARAVARVAGRAAATAHVAVHAVHAATAIAGERAAIGWNVNRSKKITSDYSQMTNHY